MQNIKFNLLLLLAAVENLCNPLPIYSAEQNALGINYNSLFKKEHS